MHNEEIRRLKELSGIKEAPVEENFVDDMPYGLADGMTFTDGDPDYDYRGDPTNNGEVSWPEINNWHKDENGNVKPGATIPPEGFEINDLVSGLSDAQPDLLQGMTFTDGEPDYDYTGAPMNDGEVDWPEINDWHKDENGNVKPEATMKPKGFNVGDLVPF